MNRLQLDFQIQSREDRVAFVKEYLAKIRFRPTEDELDTIAKYILWGVDKNGLNGRQEGLELETRHKTWDGNRVESLDALIESPSFSETMLRGPHDAPTRFQKEVFSRTQVRQNAPLYIREALEALWCEIDRVELTINFYDIAHEKRKTPPRPALLNRFTEEDQSAIKAAATKLQPYAYLKLKHKLVELRREQYTYKDYYAEPHLSQPTFSYMDDFEGTFDADFSVLPIGLPSDSELMRKIFNEERFPEPNDFTEEDLAEISKLLWKKTECSKRFFDFRNTDHLYELFAMWEDFLEPASSIHSNMAYFARAAKIYVKLARLEPYLEDIWEMKVKKKSNQEIVEVINEKYGKKYRSNYISTLYCKKCLALIAAAAKEHREVLENIFFPENFKKCKDCGRVLLMNEDNFVKRSRSNDGFSPRCKCCEKIKRMGRK